MLHWSQPPAGTPAERLSWAWPSPRLVKLEVLTLELLFLLVAPHTPEGAEERPPGTKIGPVHICPHMVVGVLASGALEAKGSLGLTRAHPPCFRF